MSGDEPSAADLIDTARYPLDQADHPAMQALIPKTPPQATSQAPQPRTHESKFLAFGRSPKNCRRRSRSVRTRFSGRNPTWLGS